MSHREDNTPDGPGRGPGDADALEKAAMELMLDALEQPDAQRNRWLSQQTEGQPLLRARVLALLAADAAEAGETLRTGGAAGDFLDAPLPERIGAYRIIRAIGEGGMGTVYLGERDAGDFEHTAAIKVIRPGALSPPVIERFFNERQTLARLSHPHIARLFDGGETAQGAPYIVMEFVDGEPVLDWAERVHATLDQRLDLLDDICSAVAHAHRNLIIHRDITPGNVLVCRDGGAKLIDFGISRPETPGVTPSGAASDSRSFTPGYAAPEHEAGGDSNTLSDIYSLGRLMADLVAPVGGDTRRELSAIAAKASAAAPDARYQSVEAMADDLRRYRERRPVAAYPGGAFYPLAKLVSRRRAVMSAAGLALAGLIGALIVTTTLYTRAEAERRAADQRFNEVRSLAGFMIFDLYDELQKVPGNTRTIARLAEEAQTYLDSLSADRRASLEVSLDTVRGYKRLADILGNPDIANLGERTTAGEMLSRALDDAEALYAAHPGNDEVIRVLGEVAFSAATHSYVATSDSERTLQLARRSAQMWGQLAARPTADLNVRSEYIRARLMTAVPLPWMGRHAEGVETLKTVREEAARLAGDFPDEPSTRLLLGSLNIELARAIVRSPDGSFPPGASLPYWDEAIALRLASYEENPDDLRPYRSLAVAYYERGAVYRNLGEYDAAYADALRTEEIALELLERDPDDAWLQRIRGGVMDEKARTLSYAGRHEEAVAEARASLQRQRADFQRDTGNPGLRREWGYSLVLIADVFMRAGDTAGACPLASEARQVWDKLAGDEPVSELDRRESLALLDEIEAGCERG